MRALGTSRYISQPRRRPCHLANKTKQKIIVVFGLHNKKQQQQPNPSVSRIFFVSILMSKNKQTKTLIFFKLLKIKQKQKLKVN